MSVAAAAAAPTLEHVPSWLKKVEAGDLGPTVPDTEALLRLYGVDEAHIAPVLTVAQDARRMSWWVRTYGAEAMPIWFRKYADMEASATRLRTAQALLIPGLLQTSAYAGEVLERNPFRSTETSVHRQVALRMDRQAILTDEDHPTRLEFVLHESALRHRVGTPAVMADQVARLIAAAELPHVDLRVLPLDAQVTIESQFCLITPPAPPAGYPAPDPDDELVYLESYTEGRYLEDRDDLRLYRAVWDHTFAQSLDQAATRTFLLAVEEDWKAKI